MYCPFCGNEDTRVVDSRLANEGDQVRRRRECVSCGDRFSTYEYAVFNIPPVIKSTGEKQPFDPHKLRVGLMRATQKRPVDSKSIDRAIVEIQKEILKCLKADGDSNSKGTAKKITTNLIGEYVMEELRKMDDVAYIRFASVYRDFHDIGEFIEEIKSLENQPNPEFNKRQRKLPGAE